jgi:hypothetical protein
MVLAAALLRRPQEGGAAMKSFEVTAFFPGLVPAHQAYQSCSVDAPDLALAARRGLRVIRKRDAIRGKQLREVQMKIRQVQTENK